jgi:hypothetical protein
MICDYATGLAGLISATGFCSHFMAVKLPRHFTVFIDETHVAGGSLTTVSDNK